MLEDEVVSCPVCDKAIKVGKVRDVYICEDCPHCKVKGVKIEKLLNQTKSSVKVERSYFKLDPRG